MGMEAASGGYQEVGRVLIEANADVNIPDNRGATPLVAAFKKGHTRTCAWLVKDSGCTLPSGVECERIMQTLKTDNEMTPENLEKCKDCYSIIDLARRQKEEESNAKAKALLDELELEELDKINKQSKKANKKKKKAEKKEAERKAKEEEERKKREEEEKKRKQEEDKRKKEEAKN